MKKTILLFAFLVVAAPALHAAIDTLDNVPAATLLLPYFQVDLTQPSTPRTTLTIGNIAASPSLAHVTLWTDLGVPSYSFDVRLDGQGTLEIDLTSIFLTGVLPQTTAGSFPGCPAVLPPASLSASTLTALQNAHTGRSSSLFTSSNCGGSFNNDFTARGYVTVDVTSACTSDFPSTPGYFANGGTGIALNNNVLWGEYATVDAYSEVSYGDSLVAIEADATNPVTDGAGDYTFYGRQIGETGADNREALPQQWYARYINAGTFSRTEAIVWRDAGNTPSFPCNTPPAGLGVPQFLVFDEQEQPSVECPAPPLRINLAAQSINLNSTSKVSVPFDSGFIVYNLQRTVPSGSFGWRNQSFVSHVLRTGHTAGQLSGWSISPITESNVTLVGAFTGGCPQCDDGIDNDGDGLVDASRDPGCRGSIHGVENPECSDGLDNDGDTFIDYPNDPHCWGPFDRLEFEYNPGVQSNPACDDGVDNDFDSQTDWPNDFGCAFNPFNSEPSPQCNDGGDNDGDTLIDYPNDPQCSGPSDPTEFTPQCSDGLDNDLDTFSDFPNDIGCSDPNDNSEANAVCSDGLDNDGDSFIDYPSDPGCASPTSFTENPQCNNGVSDDGDLPIDMADPGCSSPSDTSEGTQQCSDGRDNDGDGIIDFPNETGCSSPTDDDERGDCQDAVGDPPFAIDNDLDGLANFPADPGCASATDLNELAGTTTRSCSDGVDNDFDGLTDYPADPGCTSRWDDVEYNVLVEQAAAEIPALSPLSLALLAALLAMVAAIALRGGIMNG